MKCYVVIKNSLDGANILYCGTDESIAKEKLYNGNRVSISMEIWENGSYIETKWGNR